MNIIIARIPIIPSVYPVEFKWLQFPVKLYIIMIINTAHGQFLKEIGKEREEYFSHGHLYVACSKS
jgi:hypothetical protein